MRWLELLAGLWVQLAKWFNDKRLMQAGADKAELESLKDANDKIDAANNARANVDKLSIESDPQNRANKPKL